MGIGIAYAQTQVLHNLIIDPEETDDAELLLGLDQVDIIEALAQGRADPDVQAVVKKGKIPLQVAPLCRTAAFDKRNIVKNAEIKDDFPDFFIEFYRPISSYIFS